MSTHQAVNAWVVSDGAAGNARQALALARALDLKPRVVNIDVRAPWRWLAPRLTTGAHAGLHDHAGVPIEAPWPDIAIGCGRQAALLTRMLRRWSKGACFTVQILDPRIVSDHFDVVVAPLHDHLAGNNVIETIGSLNPVDDAWLADARPRFAAMTTWPTPRTAVLIGASHRAQTLDVAYFDALRGQLAAWFARDGGSFLVTTSWRTPAELSRRLRGDFARWPGMFWSSEGDGENPYAGLLAWADRIVVTPDSVNMLSEACATGKPVHTLTTQPLHGKLGELHTTLRAGGYLQAMQPLPSQKRAAALRETGGVAALVRARWKG